MGRVYVRYLTAVAVVVVYVPMDVGTCRYVLQVEYALHIPMPMPMPT